MRRTHENSLSAYDSILDRLPQSRARVFQVIAIRGPLTRADIAERMQIPINRVTGRVKELLEEGLVIECGTQKSHNSPARALLRVRPTEPEQGSLEL